MIFFNQQGVKCQTEMEFESPSLPGLGPHNDRGFGVFACPHPRFRELDFCRSKSGSSTITIKDVDRYMEDLTRPSKHQKKSKEKKVVETIEETASKEVAGIDTNAKEEDSEQVKEDVEDEMEADISALEIFKPVEKPTFGKPDALDEEAEDLNESEDIPEVEKLGPKLSYTPQDEGEVSEMRSAEVSGKYIKLFSRQ